MDPINYILDVKSPIEQAIKGYGLGRQEIEQNQIMAERSQMMDLRAAQEARVAAQEEERRATASRERAKADAMQAQLVGLREQAANGTLTVDALNQFSLANAENFSDFATAFSQIEAEKSRPQVQFNIQTAIPALTGNSASALTLFDERIAAAENAGATDEAQALRANRAILEADPQAYAVSMLGTLVATGAIDNTQAETILKLAGQTQPSKADVQSTDYIGGIAVVTTLKDGKVQIKDARTDEIVTGDTAKKLLDEAREGEAAMAGGKAGAAEAAKLGAQVDLGRVAAAETEMGAKAVQLGIDAFSRIGLVNANIANLDRAIQLVEEEGANTGVIASKLPSWSDASVELNNMQNTLGLDVIGAVTFGALSEGELALALQTALPTNLSEDRLSNWLRTKKAAQKKLSGYLTQQAEFFSTGRGPDQWLAFVRSGEKNVDKWMRENPLGRSTTAPAPAAAAPAGGRVRYDENGNRIQ